MQQFKPAPDPLSQNLHFKIPSHFIVYGANLAFLHQEFFKLSWLVMEILKITFSLISDSKLLERINALGSIDPYLGFSLRQMCNHLALGTD